MDIKITHGIMPTTNSESAGYDLATPVTLNLKPNECFTLDLGIHLHIKRKSLTGLIYTRSSTGSAGLHLQNVIGVIDSDYTGPLILKLINRGTKNLSYSIGDRIAQLVFHRIEKPTLNSVLSLQDTERSSGGFGSTGK